MIQGKVIVLGDNVDTDQILPGYAMAEPMEKLKDFAMAGVPDLEFSKIAKPGYILAAGKNFGCGSSREQAPLALKNAGIALIAAKSFARIFRRNAINIGLPVFEADIVDDLDTGDEITVCLKTGEAKCNGKRYQGKALSEKIMKTLEYGGLIPQVRAELQAECVQDKEKNDAGKNKTYY